MLPVTAGVQAALNVRRTKLDSSPWQEGMDTALGLSFSWEKGADGLRRTAFGVWSVSDHVTKSVCCGRSGDSPDPFFRPMGHSIGSPQFFLPV